MKVFLDIGAHIGETLPAALDPRFGFERVDCFEPVAACVDALERVRDGRVAVHRFGLLHETCERPIFDPGSVGASIYQEKRSGSEASETVRFTRASDWFAANLGAADDVYAKLNCEGSECDILTDLLDSGEIAKVRALLVHLDIRKIPSQRHRAEEVLARLEGAGVPYEIGDPRSGPSHVARVERWLDAAGATAPPGTLRPAARARSAAIRLRYVAVPAAVRSLRLGVLVRRVLGRRLHLRIRSRVLGYTFEGRRSDERR